MMSSGDSGNISTKGKSHPTDTRDANTSPSDDGTATWFLLGIGLIALICLIIGILSHGFEWKRILTAAGSMLSGIAFMAIGLLELEWLERIVGIFDGIFGLVVQWCWTSWYGSLSDADALGRRGASVIWMIAGIALYISGCLIALRVIKVF
ncbi:hypothetical protein KIH39_17615 [Telmatocola sphagniphila]|uniref:Uncharacterized protein n=1 Tax=Telmatocola sphagniphila TaxID=1123043 RepID=A0A8E6B533_9BACT|nr:hypothetical protein [Telmatocola sphagniphila]QVL30663.1 hypothetical protein KIH39_17615 [Telmatocola sphagniphila]